MGKYIDGSGLSHFMGILKGAFAAKSTAISNITRSGTTFTATRADGTSFTFDQQDSTVAKTMTTPKMDGTAAIGTETKYAAGDHVHPTDTSRFAASSFTAANIASTLGTTAVNRATADASGNNIANTYATKTELGTATAGALQYKGTATKESDISGQAYKKGWYYVVATAGTYFGKVCEVGDMLIAKQDKTSTTSNDWDAVQSNIEVLSNSEIDALWAAA